MTLAALFLVGALALDVGWGRTVRLLHNAKNPAEQEEWRRLRDPSDDPAEIYGQPEGRPLRVLVFDAARLVVPPEAPGSALLVTERAAGDLPLQTRTLWRWAVTAALSALALAALAQAGRAWGWTKRRVSSAL